MALPVREQITYWGIASLAVLAVLFVLGDVILPFVLGGAIAYCLDPIADRLERLGLSRILSTIVITLVAIVVFVIMALLVFPTLIRQSVQLVETAPTLFQTFQAALTERFPTLLEEGSILRSTLTDLGETLRAQGGALANRVFTSALSLLNVVILVVLVPVITFYLLLDWDRMVARIDALLPRDHAPVVRRLATEIDATLASFIRGQGTVCVILGTYYAAALMLAGLQFGLVVGFVAGLITFIPYVGALVGGALAIGLALFQFWGEWPWIGLVAVIFIIGQFFEGNILTPNLVGSSVGLHPVWLIFALSAFGTLFGFTGMLVAVPLAAAMGVILRFGIERYKAGRLYRGLGHDSDDAADQDAE